MEILSKKALLFLLSILFFAPFLLKAQAFKEDDNIISIGYGAVSLDTYVEGDFTVNDSYNTSYDGPFYLKYERALTDKISMGINFAYAYYSGVPGNAGMSDEFYYYKQTLSTFSSLARLNWHFATKNKFDPYFGFGLGYRSMEYTEYSTENAFIPRLLMLDDFFPIGFEATMGARYYVNKTVAFYIETGIAKSVVQAGMSFKFK